MKGHTLIKMRGKIYSPNLEAKGNIFTYVTGDGNHGEKNMPQSAWAAIAKLPYPGIQWVAYEQQAFISYNSRGLEVQDWDVSRSSVWWDSVSGKSPSP